MQIDSSPKIGPESILIWLECLAILPKRLSWSCVSVLFFQCTWSELMAVVLLTRFSCCLMAMPTHPLTPQRTRRPRAAAAVAVATEAAAVAAARCNSALWTKPIYWRSFEDKHFIHFTMFSWSRFCLRLNMRHLLTYFKSIFGIGLKLD